MIRPALAAVLLVAIVFAAVGALTFPTDAIVAAILDRVPLPDHLQLTFATAHLRPDGLRLDEVHVVRPSGRAAFDAEWLRLWPSLWGLWRDPMGRPWSLAAGACQGTIDVDIGIGSRGMTAVTVALERVELESCLLKVLPQMNVVGRVGGRFSALVGPGSPSSEGTLDVRGAAWTPGGPLGDMALRADAGEVVWRLADGRLEITRFEATSTDGTARGSGFVRVLTPLDDSVLDVRVAVTPGPTMPPRLRRYLDVREGTTPDAQGTRTFRIQGTLRDPRLAAPGRP